MIIRVRRRKERPYVVLETATLRMKHISFKARGLWAICMSYPDDWEFRLHHLESMSERDGEVSVRSALEELKAVGLVTFEQLRAESGRISSGHWTIYENPSLNISELEGENDNPSNSPNLPD